MMTLYHSPATAAMVVHWLLIELELPHRLHPLDFEKREHKSPDYLKLNPAGVVPTLVIDDGPPILRGGRHRDAPRRSPPGPRPLSRDRHAGARPVLPLDVLPGEHAAAGLPRLVLPDRAGGRGQRRGDPARPTPPRWTLRSEPFTASACRPSGRRRSPRVSLATSASGRLAATAGARRGAGRYLACAAWRGAPVHVGLGVDDPAGDHALWLFGQALRTGAAARCDHRRARPL